MLAAAWAIGALRFLQDDACLPGLLHLLHPAAHVSAPPQCRLLLLTPRLPEETSNNLSWPLHTPSITSLFLYFHPFDLLVHQSCMLCLLACVEPHFSLLLTHKSTYRKIQREAISRCISGRPQIEIIIVAYGNLIGASKKSQTCYPT